MQLSLCPQPLYSRPLDEALALTAELGIAALELPVDRDSPWLDPDDLAANGCDALMAALGRHDLKVSAVSIHKEGQLLLGPQHDFAAGRIVLAGQIAHHLDIDVVVGFVGCEDFTRWFPWPDPKGWEKMLPRFRERVLPVLDELARLGVRFAQEPHPNQIVYNTETALESLDVLDRHPGWGFNLDAGNLLLAGVDPVVFAAELGGRVLHVHAKDGELVPHNARRSGLMAHGAWNRRDRGFRFRIPGWGDVPWRRLITELVLIDYDGYLAIENEDPVFAPVDGLRKAVAELQPLMPDGPREEQWW